MSKKKKKPRPSPASLGLPPGGMDTHAHLDFDAFDGDRAAVLERARDAGVSHLINVFLGPEPHARGAALFDEAPQVSFIMGLHPSEEELPELAPALRQMAEAFARDGRLRAIGEIGLDYHWDAQPRPVQAEVFRAQLRLARRLDVPVVIHCREAERDAVALLLEEGYSGRPLLWHCFGGDEALAAELLRHGWLISLPGPLTYRANEDLRRAAASLPAERFVVETDCPFLTPEPWRGKRNEPALVAFTAARLAEVRGEPADELWQRCGETGRRLFGIEG